MAGTEIGSDGWQVREAGVPDRAAVTHSLAEAFWDDPMSTWASPHDGARPRVLRRFFSVQLRHRLPAGFVYTDEARTGAAIWAPPKTWRTTAFQDLQLMHAFAHPRHWPHAPIVAYGLLGLERAHPPEPPHFYLATLGVSPAAQGRGLGSRLLQPVLELCDADGVPAYLVSSKESNIAFYSRHGFRVTQEISLPRGPTVWAMWREPLG